MSLRSKIILILSAVVVVYASADLFLLQRTVATSFRNLERSLAARDVERVLASIDGQATALDNWVQVWAGMDSTRRYVSGADSNALAADLSDDLIASNGLHLLFLCDAEGNVLWSRIESADARERIRLRSFPSEQLLRGNPAMRLAMNDKGGAGLMETEQGILVVSAHPVSGRADEPAGYVLAGQFFDESVREAVSERAGVDFDIWSQALVGVEDERSTYGDQATGSELPIIDDRDDDTLRVYKAVEDVEKYMKIVVRAEVPRDVTAHGASAVNYALLSAPAIALVILFTLLKLLDRIVIRPLGTLTEHAVEVGQTDDTAAVSGIKRDDEIGTLALEFDRMLDKLRHSREQTVKTARLAGMSEIATGVLHNVGNVLNSVNVAATIANKKAHGLPTKDLARLTEVLKGQEDLGKFLAEDPRGRHLVPLLDELSSNFALEKEEMIQEMTSLRTGIEHMAELVRSQQTYAGTRGVFELADLGKQIDGALHICRQAYGGADEVEVVRELEDLDRVHVDKHKLMEILVNLIQNARQALRDSGRADMRLVIRLSRVEERFARIEVQDNGVGIPSKNLTAIFKHGFTTKKHGHGFGLHVSANAATEMGCSLSATSEGPGKGATFILDIPLELDTRRLAA